MFVIKRSAEFGDWVSVREIIEKNHPEIHLKLNQKTSQRYSSPAEHINGLRDVVDDIVSSNRDAPDATFSDSLAHLRRRRSHCGFSRGDNRCADAADNPARYRRSVVVDNGKAEKFVGSSGNTGSNSCAALVLLRFKLRTSEQNKFGLQNIETFVGMRSSFLCGVRFCRLRLQVSSMFFHSA